MTSNSWIADIQPLHQTDTLLLLIKLISSIHANAPPYLNGASATTTQTNKQTYVCTNTIRNESIPNVRHINKYELCLLGKWTEHTYTYMIPIPATPLSFAQLLLLLHFPHSVSINQIILLFHNGEIVWRLTAAYRAEHHQQLTHTCFKFDKFDLRNCCLHASHIYIHSLARAMPIFSEWWKEMRHTLSFNFTTMSFGQAQVIYQTNMVHNILF